MYYFVIPTKLYTTGSHLVEFLQTYASDTYHTNRVTYQVRSSQGVPRIDPGQLY